MSSRGVSRSWIPGVPVPRSTKRALCWLYGLAWVLQCIGSAVLREETGSSHGQGTQPRPRRSTVGAHDSQGPPCTWWLVRAEASKSRRARDLQDSALCIATRSDSVYKGSRDNTWRKFPAGPGLLDAAAPQPPRLCISDPTWREVSLTLEEHHGLWIGDQGQLEALASRAGLTGRLGRTFARRVTYKHAIVY